jgi:hypothetical protein
LFWSATHPDDPAAYTLYSAELTFSGNAVRVATSGPVFPPHVRIAPLIDNRSQYAAAPDGQRFLLRQAEGLPRPTVKVILNWKEQLRVR